MLLLFKHMALASSMVVSPPEMESFDLAGYKEKVETLTRELAATSEALASERNMLRALLDNLPDFIFIKDTASRYILSNAAHTRSLGLTSAREIEGKTVFDLFARHVAERFAADDAHVFATGESIINREEIRCGTTQKQRWVLTTKFPLRGLRGEIAGVMGISRDISEYKHLEEELRQSQKMEAIGRLAGGIAHDFNNILTSIIGFGELLLNNSSLDPVAHKDAEEIYAAAVRASALTQQLLAFSRKQNIEPVMTDLNDVVRRLDVMLHRLVGENIAITTLTGSGLKPIVIDAGQIEQVITNVVVNASDAMPEGGSLVLETGCGVLDEAEAQRRAGIAPGPYVWLSIKDDGAGIPDDVKARIFEPFFTTKASGKGPGLGLSAAYGIVKQSGGYIDIESKPGHGTTVTIYLPVGRKEPPARHPRPTGGDGPLPLGNETVLLVEDDPSVRKLTSSLLVKLGYTVLEAGDGAKAMEVIRECDTQKIDLLLTDVIMPQIGGKRLADNLEVLSPGTRVLFTSGHNEEEMRLQGLAAGEIAFLPKPFSPALLAGKIREVLDREKS